MSVDCRVYMPPAAQLRDVADVLALQAGFKPTLNKYGVESVAGLKVEPSSYPGMAYIYIGTRRTTWQWESDYPHLNYHTMIFGSTAWWIAMARGLVDFFGGAVSYKDYDDNPDYSRFPPLDLYNDGAELWVKLQKRIVAVKPIPADVIKECDQWAAYKGYYTLEG